MIAPIYYKRHRFATAIIANAVWLCFRFSLSLRILGDLLAGRGIIVSHQTIKTWAKIAGLKTASFLQAVRVMDALTVQFTVPSKCIGRSHPEQFKHQAQGMCFGDCGCWIDRKAINELQKFAIKPQGGP